ncbi:MAG: hypothetical protein LBD09_02005 [Treponema sp.]|jgi:hypothetical protein|nr:hypothetical protein [Treponema sp.]
MIRLGPPFFFCLLLSAAAAASAAVEPDSPVFPRLYFTAHYAQWLRGEAARPYRAATELEVWEEKRNALRPLFLNNDIIAFYGHPLSPNMGILGRHEPAELNTMLNALAAEYNEVNGRRGVRKAFYLIYGTVQPGGEIGYIPEAVLQSYIRFALEQDMLIFIDHQIGRYDPLDSLKTMLPYLQYPNVHLALDPEWRTDRPMRLIGSVTAAEINGAQELVSAYLAGHRLPGERMLVIHQFHHGMIKDREDVRTGFAQVTLVHCADGFGSPELKRDTYAYNARARNMPVKGFKLFYNLGIPGAGYDEPLLLPPEVNDLSPRPSIVMYQ